jgi:hypothetical protein
MTEQLNELPSVVRRRAVGRGRGVGLALAEARADESAVWLAIESLRPGDSPRAGGVDANHVRVLAETDAVLPPILVHRDTMCVIDGMHRLRAAQLKGCELIEARYFDGSLDDAFVMAVEANVAHGLPLSLADRRAAAARIVATHPDWSDRAIAAVTGLAPGTVGAVRSRRGEEDASAARRIGRDGRSYPVDAAIGRRAVSQVIALRPDATLREIARNAGVSPATARAVRERLRRDEDPVTSGCLDSDARRIGASAQGGRTRRGGSRAQRPRPASRDRESIVRGLRRDPALYMTDSGRELLRWLLPQAVGVEGWRNLVEAVPPHCSYVIADLARSCASEWLEFARQLETRLE